MADDLVACPKCGVENGPEAKFCQGCGAPLDGSPAPAVAATTSSKPAKKTTGWDALSSKTKAWIVGIGVVIVIVSLAVGKKDSSSSQSDEDLRYGAMDVCEQFVEDRLKAPSTADFPLVDPDDVVRSGDHFTIVSYVDAENGFGANIRTDYVCEVRHTSGDSFNLISIDL